MIYVSLISHTPDPERTTAATARISASSAGATELVKKLTPEAADRLFNHLPASRHPTHSNKSASPSPTSDIAMRGRLRIFPTTEETPVEIKTRN
jgi:hypothetical protein